MSWHEMDPELLGALREAERLQSKNDYLENKNFELQQEIAQLKQENRYLDKDNDRLRALLDNREPQI